MQGQRGSTEAAGDVRGEDLPTLTTIAMMYGI